MSSANSTIFIVSETFVVSFLYMRKKSSQITELLEAPYSTGSHSDDSLLDNIERKKLNSLFNSIFVTLAQSFFQ